MSRADNFQKKLETAAKNSSYLNFGGNLHKNARTFYCRTVKFFHSGVGQIYNGRIVAGVLWLVLTGVSWIGSAGTLGWIVHLIAAWCAYSYAKDNRIR